MNTEQEKNLVASEHTNIERIYSFNSVIYEQFISKQKEKD